MRLWSLHPKYLDPKGLVALWREALLAQAVLRGATRGYQKHPQLARFRQQPEPLFSIAAYLEAVCAEAKVRGYAFDARKIGGIKTVLPIPVTQGQVAFETQHLLRKLEARQPLFYAQFCAVSAPESHPRFCIVPGGLEAWERL